MDPNDITKNQAQSSAPEQKPAAGRRKVFGVDGQEPITEHEFERQSWDPELVRQADEAIAASAAKQQAVGAEAPDADGNELEDLRRKYAELEAQHNGIASYGGIINALKSDPGLVATMQRAISGELYDIENKEKGRRNAEFGDSFREPDGDDTDAPNRDQKTREQGIANRAARETELRIEMQTVMREMMQTGASEEEVNRFIAFVNQPGGLTMHDLLTVYRGREKPGQPNQPATEKTSAPAPLASAAGHTDRPKGESRYQSHEAGNVGNYFPGNANAY